MTTGVLNNYIGKEVIIEMLEKGVPSTYAGTLKGFEEDYIQVSEVKIPFHENVLRIRMRNGQDIFLNRDLAIDFVYNYSNKKTSKCR